MPLFYGESSSLVEFIFISSAFEYVFHFNLVSGLDATKLDRVKLLLEASTLICNLICKLGTPKCPF